MKTNLFARQNFKFSQKIVKNRFLKHLQKHILLKVQELIFSIFFQDCLRKHIFISYSPQASWKIHFSSPSPQVKHN